MKRPDIFGGYRYRDKSTGRFVTKKTWNRDKRDRIKREPQRRNRGVTMRLGYTSSRDNSFAMEIDIKSRRQLTDASFEKLIIRLLRAGHFDESEEFNADLQWTAGLINSSSVIREGSRLRPGHARLVLFEREQP